MDLINLFITNKQVKIQLFSFAPLVVLVLSQFNLTDRVEESNVW